MNWSEYTYKTVKGWEGKEPFWVWHIQSMRTPAGFEKNKCYLIIDARTKSFGVRLSDEKPEGLKPTGSMQALIRKYAKSPTIGTIARSEHTIWIPLFVAPGDLPGYWMTLTKDRPPELRVVDSEGVCIVKRTQQGTYTKKSTFEIAPPESADELISASLCLPDDKGEEEEPGAAETSLLPEFQRKARDQVARRVKTARKGFAKLEQDLPSQEVLVTLDRDARLLQQFLYRVKGDMHTLTLHANDTGLNETIVIELDPDVAPGRNLENCFVALKKKTKARELGQKRLEQLRKQKDELEGDLIKLRAGPMTEADVNFLLDKHKISRPQVASGKGGVEAKPFRRYAVSDSVVAMVGKSAKDNDELTKNARGHDLWLHIVGPPGSHVILQKRKKDPISDADIRNGAILAIHNSKLREDQAGEVYVTPKRHIKKKKGLPAGKWIIEQAETLFVRFDDTELKSILAKLEA